VTRILFVDDERRILEGLQRMLRPRRKEWAMTFADSGKEALAILAENAFDIIVSDMRMPDMDGARLLELVRQQYPGMIRIVLSGQFEMEAAMRAVPVAHQFVLKPCDHEKLQEVIGRSRGADSLEPDEATRKMVAAIGELPALPGTYAALVRALDDPAVALDQVGAIVERDVGVAAKVLQLVNSSFFGLSHEIATVPKAVAHLGFDVLKQLVITVELFNTFADKCQVAGFSVEEVQRHSRCVAAITAHLPLPKKDAAAASVAALLHDVGKLVLAARSPEQFERVLRASRKEHRPLYTLEKELTGTSHAEIGAYLLSLWGLPPGVVAAVSQHHRAIHVETAATLDIGPAIHLANILEHEAAGKPGSPSLAAYDSIDTNFATSSEFLPAWRRTAVEIVREAQCFR
jgi:putative nucleotidyltransferase with HDIG domain